MRRAPHVRLSQSERRRLLSIAHEGDHRRRRSVRARIILLAARGWDNRHIAEHLGTTAVTVGLWRRRFVVHRLPGIEKDAPRPGRPPRIPTAALGRILLLHRASGAAQGGPWSSRAVAREVGVSKTTVLRVWQAHREAGLRFGEDDRGSISVGIPQHITDFVGLYLNPPDRALAFSVDRRTAGQGPGAPSPLQGPRVPPRNPGVEFRSFLQAIHRETPKDLNVYLLAESAEGPSSIEVRRWLVHHPRFHIQTLHPLTAPHPNLLDRLLGDLSRKRVRRSGAPGPSRLNQAIRAHFATLGVPPGPFVWTATAEEIRRRPNR